MDSRDKKSALTQIIIDRPHAAGYALACLYVLINAFVNATSEWMEAMRSDSNSLEMWEPFSWEYTSAISVIALLPLIFWLFKKFPPRFGQVKGICVMLLFGSLIYSLLHVSLMVLMREAVYWSMGGNYDFGDIGREFLYEYRKDAWGFLIFYLVYHTASFVYARLHGDANVVAQVQQTEQAEEPPLRQSQHVLVKKLDKEFLLAINDIDWLEASGNYVNLHSNGRIYPMRGTLSTVTERLASAGFSRVQRSVSVNHRKIASIEYAPSGDGAITLKDGHQLPLSRRYKDQFKQQFELVS